MPRVIGRHPAVDDGHDGDVEVDEPDAGEDAGFGGDEGHEGAGEGGGRGGRDDEGPAVFGVADAEGAEEDGQDRDGAAGGIEDRGLLGVVAYVAQ